MKNNRSLIARIIAGLVAFVFALPLYLAVVNVFKTEEQITRYPVALPAPFTLENLITVLTRPDNLLFEGLKNSLIITICSVITVVFFSSAIGFSIARSDKRYMQVLLLVFVAGMMVPTQVVLIPVARMLNWFWLLIRRQVIRSKLQPRPGPLQDLTTVQPWQKF